MFLSLTAMLGLIWSNRLNFIHELLLNFLNILHLEADTMGILFLSNLNVIYALFNRVKLTVEQGVFGFYLYCDKQFYD